MSDVAEEKEKSELPDDLDDHNQVGKEDTVSDAVEETGQFMALDGDTVEVVARMVGRNGSSGLFVGAMAAAVGTVMATKDKISRGADNEETGE